MLLQTNSYVVPKEKRAEHNRLLRRFRQALARLGCTDFEVYEQVGTNWSADQSGGRFVQIMRFRDRKHQLAVQAAEREDPVAQALVAEFCELINFPYQQENNLFAVGYYTALLGPTHSRVPVSEDVEATDAAAQAAQHSAAWEAGPRRPFAPAESVEPFGEPAPDLSRLAQEFVRSARPPEEPEVAPSRVDNDADVVEHADGLQVEEEAAPAQDEVTPVEQPSNGNGKFHFRIPQYAAEWRDHDEHPAEAAAAGPTEEPVPSLDELLDMEIGQTASADEEPTIVQSIEESESSGIGHVLEASLADDELDIALPAELVDPAELDACLPQSDPPHALRGDAVNRRSRSS